MADKKKEDKLMETPDEYKDMDGDQIKSEIEALEAAVKTKKEELAPQQIKLNILKRHLIMQGLGCKHEKLTKIRDRFYVCDECKRETHAKVRD